MSGNKLVRTRAEVSAMITGLRENVLMAPPAVCIERGYWITQSYKETESQPAVIRKANALDKILQKMTVTIEDGELIVGRATSKLRGSPLFPELQWKWLLDEMDVISTRDWDRFSPLTKEEKATIRGFLPYWEGRALQDKWRALIPEEALRLNGKIQSGSAYSNNNQYYGHTTVDYWRVLTVGLNGIKEHIHEESKRLTLNDMGDFEKYQFLKAVDITLDAAINFAKRYSDLARTLAKKEADASRKVELEQIAEICNRVPANPARTFYEALQSVWFIYVVLMVESWGAGTSLGRSDQYLYPFYIKDLEEGRITREEARQLLSLFLIKPNELVTLRSSEAVKTFSGLHAGASITLGGVTSDGKDATNELSYLFLDAEKDVRLNQEDFIIRVHKNALDSFLMKACEVAKLLKGKLKFVSDEMTIKQLLCDGKPPELARDFHITGCNSPGIVACSLDIPGGIVNLPLMLELALNNGVSRLTGEQIGPMTGDPKEFKSYEEVWNAYKNQVEDLIPIALLFKNVDKQLYPKFAPTPFQSALLQGCIEKGLDVTDGGTSPYVSHAISLGGAPNVGDSLAAIKKTVFEDKRLTMDRLIDALSKNFEGEEEVLRLLNSVPKFGNDNDYVDSIVNEVLIHAKNQAAKVKGFKGAISNVAAGTVTANVPLGYVVGALPDGRKACQPISEGGISPHQGRNISGPTATMRSIAKLDLVQLTNGSVLNMRFTMDALEGESKMRKFAALIRTFLETGGFLVQFNIVSTDTLKDAQRHPEKYKDLLVRVATYSAYFVELSPALQNDIIARVEFGEV